MAKSKIFKSLALAVMATLALCLPAGAATLTQDFQANEPLAKGTVVSLDKRASIVVQASRDNIKNLYGVVAMTGDISFTQSEQQTVVPVANTGVVKALVSTANGDIHIGDPITVNQVEGVGEKAIVSGRVLGVAQGVLSARSEAAKQFTIGSGSSKKNIVVGLIPVKISVSDYTSNSVPLDQEDGQNRNRLEQIADSVAGKIVKPFALIIAGIILVIGIFVATFLITSSGYASMISIGRNPLSEKRIIRSLLGLILLAIAIFSTSVLLAFLVLKLLG